VISISYLRFFGAQALPLSFDTYFLSGACFFFAENSFFFPPIEDSRSCRRCPFLAKTDFSQAAKCASQEGDAPFPSCISRFGLRGYELAFSPFPQNGVSSPLSSSERVAANISSFFFRKMSPPLSSQVIGASTLHRSPFPFHCWCPSLEAGNQKIFFLFLFFLGRTRSITSFFVQRGPLCAVYRIFFLLPGRMLECRSFPSSLRRGELDSFLFSLFDVLAPLSPSEVSGRSLFALFREFRSHCTFFSPPRAE